MLVGSYPRHKMLRSHIERCPALLVLGGHIALELQQGLHRCVVPTGGGDVKRRLATGVEAVPKREGLQQPHLHRFSDMECRHTPILKAFAVLRTVVGMPKKWNGNVHCCLFLHVDSTDTHL